MLFGNRLHVRILMKDAYWAVLNWLVLPWLWLASMGKRPSGKLVVGAPKLKWEGGPNIFLSRLQQKWREEGLIETVPYTRYHHISLQATTGRRFLGRPYVLRVDGLYLDIRDTMGDSKLLNGRIFRSIDEAAGVVFISDFSRKLIFNNHKPLAKPVAVIHNAVDTRDFRPDGPNFRDRLGKDFKYVVCSAAWRAHKRLGEIVRCFQQLDRPDARLLVLGAPDRRVDDPRIIYAGHIHPQELATWYRTGHVFFHLEWLEACGNSPLEAMACGLPIVCSNQGGLPEVVRRVDGGTIVDTDDEYDFGFVDRYHPPVIRNREKVVEALNHYLDQSHRPRWHDLDIRVAAERYRNFIELVHAGFREGKIRRNGEAAR